MTHDTVPFLFVGLIDAPGFIKRIRTSNSVSVSYNNTDRTKADWGTARWEPSELQVTMHGPKNGFLTRSPIVCWLYYSQVQANQVLDCSTVQKAGIWIAEHWVNSPELQNVLINWITQRLGQGMNHFMRD